MAHRASAPQELRASERVRAKQQRIEHVRLGDADGCASGCTETPMDRCPTMRRCHILKLAMATKFSQFMKELRREAADEGPEAVAELRYFRERFRLARRFAQARRKRRWTQKKLAEKTGIDQGEISHLETGDANPTYRTMYAVAAALGAKIDLVG